MPAKKKPAKDQPAQVSGIVGLGLDNQDQQKRITRTEEMLLVGGSAETHEQMQETAIKFSESLEKAGKKLPELPLKQVIDMLREAQERNKST